MNRKTLRTLAYWAAVAYLPINGKVAAIGLIAANAGDWPVFGVAMALTLPQVLLMHLAECD